MQNRIDEIIFNSEHEHDMCYLIGRAVIELSGEQQPVTPSTLAHKLRNMADDERDDDRVLLYWRARKAITPARQNVRSLCHQVSIP